MINFNLYLFIYKNLYTLVTSLDLNSFYCIGFLLGFFFSFQMVSGMLLSFIYNNSFNYCWYSVLSMTDFEFGFLCSSTHMTGTTYMYMLLYMHMFKVFYQVMLHNTSLFMWFIGIVIYFLTVIIAFIGYVLPMTQMSYWGLTVFSNILSTIPYFGFNICYWIWGSEFMQDFTLVKVHSLHMFLPFLLMMLMLLHIIVLHLYLSSDNFFDRYSFYYEKSYFFFFFFWSDLSLLFLFLNIYMWFMFMYWYYVFHEESFELVNTMKTSDKVMPEWFFLTFFGFIKAMPDKFGGMCVLIMFMVMFMTLMFFNNKYNLVNKYYLLFLFNNNLIILLLYYIGFLSVNVTLLYPYLYLDQLYCLFMMSFYIIKVI